MSTVTVRKNSTWRTEFMYAESKFFKIPPSEWRASLEKKIKTLGLNYTNTVHEFHVSYLNRMLNLNPKLSDDDFNGEMKLVTLREEVIADRVITSITVILPPGDKALADMGLSHLNSGE